MRKIALLIVLCFLMKQSDAQIELVKLLGDKGKDFKLGYGAFIKFSFPVSEGTAITAETAFNFWFYNDDSGDGMAIIPLKLGYRYFVSGSQSGFYLEPQAGYNIYGVESDTKFHGFVWAAGTGFQFGERTTFDIGIRYESVIYNASLGGPLHFIGFRLSHNFGFGRR